MRFIHCADIHLDSPFVGLAARPDAPREVLKDATRRAFSALVDFALREKVDFVVIAGDLYDGRWRDYTTGLFFVAEMGRLARAGIPAFVLHGNHDAESLITRKLTLPDNVRVFGAGRPETFRLGDQNVFLHGQSFADRAVSANLAARYPQPVTDAVNIGVLHTALDGHADHAPYAPCALSELAARGYDYWALGHVHTRREWADAGRVVFPGNLQGRNIRETGAKGFSLVTLRDGRVADVAHVPVDVVRWSRVVVDVGGAVDLDSAIARIRPELGAGIDQCDGRVPILRLILRGETPAHAALCAERDHLIGECHAAALSVAASAWLEKVVVETLPPRAEGSAPTPDAVSALFDTIDGIATDEAVLASLHDEFAEFVDRLPPDLRRTLRAEEGGLDPALLADLLAEARALIAARIGQDGPLR